MNIISFSLWGDNPIYTIGAIKNIDLTKVFLSEWTCRFYIDSTVPKEIVKRLELDSEVIMCPDSDGFYGLFWRFYPLFDKSADRFIVRDCDSRISVRDQIAVNQWIDSNKPFHIVRDHPYHGTEVLGGTFGAVPGKLNFDSNTIPNFLSSININIHPRGRYFDTDQQFLRNVVWPTIKDISCVHDSYFTYNSNALKLPNTVNQFIGQKFNEVDSII